jgi:hypothetical protein
MDGMSRRLVLWLAATGVILVVVVYFISVAIRPLHAAHVSEAVRTVRIACGETAANKFYAIYRDAYGSEGIADHWAALCIGRQR